MTRTSEPIEIDLPFRFNRRGAVETTVSRDKQINNHIKTIIDTYYGERVMRPSYGSPIRAMVFEADDQVLHAEIASGVREAITRWEPEAANINVEVDPGQGIAGLTDGKIEVKVNYTIVDPLGQESRFSASIEVGGEVTERG